MIIKPLRFLTNLIAAVCMMTFMLDVTAQTAFNNEWIDYDKTYFKIKIARDGLYRIPYNILQEYQQQGLPLVGNAYKMYHRGKEIPIYLTNEGTLIESDYIEFLGRKNNGEFDAQLYPSPEEQTHFDRSCFTDTAVYYLTWANNTVNARFRTISNVIENPPPKENFFFHTTTLTPFEVFYGGLEVEVLDGADNFFAEFGAGEGWASAAVENGKNRDFLVQTPSVYQDPNQSLVAKAAIKVTGASDDFRVIREHDIRLKVSSQEYVDTVFEGQTTHKFKFDVPLQQLGDTTVVNLLSRDSIIVVRPDGSNEPLLDFQGNPVRAVNRTALITASFTYPHTFDFARKSSYTFNIDNLSDKYLEISNFTGGTNPILYDLTHGLRIAPIQTMVNGQTVYQFLLKKTDSNLGVRQLYFTNTSNFITTSITKLIPTSFTDFRLAAHQGNYILLTHPKLMQGSVNEIERYADYRSSVAGGNYDVIVVNIEELYDQFAWGIAKHPLSVKYFINYAIQKWNQSPEFLLIVGKSVNYNGMRNSQQEFKSCLIPTYGHRAADIMLSTPFKDTHLNQLPTGRLPAQQVDQIRIYLNKVMDYEKDLHTLPCTKEARLWLKNALHIAGGTSIAEAASFQADLNKYEQILEQPPFAGKVTASYTKTSDAIVETADVSDVINNGVRILTFVGHSAERTFNVNIREPNFYNNAGKYPMILTSSCFVGNIHTLSAASTMAEQFIFAENLGSIGFVATISTGFASYMNIYMEELYTQFVQESYEHPFGVAIQNTIANVDEAYRGVEARADGVKVTSQEYTYAGDPAVRLGAWDRPEYLTEYISPVGVTANVDSFLVKFLVTNLGKGIEDSFLVQIKRRFPNGTITIAAEQRFPATLYQDTLAMYVQTGQVDEVAGSNQLSVHVDADQAIEEDCEDNNQAESKLFVFSDLLVPISPCDFAIINEPSIKLFASTGDPEAEIKPYILEIDTTLSFNSPELQQMVLNSGAGVVEWQPTVNWKDGQVYYWRASQVPNNNENFNWQGSSFIYEPDSDLGWNQSHMGQFQQNQLTNLRLNEQNDYEYTGDFDFLKIENRYTDHARILVKINDINAIGGSCIGGRGVECTGGLVFAIMHPNLDFAVLSYDINNIPPPSERELRCVGRGTFGNIQCFSGEKKGIEFYTGDQEQVDSMLSFIQHKIPEGSYVLVYSVHNHRLGTNDPAEPIFAALPSLQQFFTDLDLPQLTNIENDQPFIALGRKGVSGFPSKFATFPAGANLPGDSAVVLEVKLPKQPSGDIYAPLIGPAKQWQSFEYDYTTIENATTSDDNLRIQIWGIQNTGAEDLLFTVTDREPLDLGEVIATTYPYLRLQAVTKDSTGLTPPQLKAWRVYFSGGIEYAMNPKQHLVFNSDTLQEGESFELSVAITNASMNEADSLLVAYTIINTNQQKELALQKTFAPLPKGTTGNLDFSYSTEGFAGDNTLLVELNSDNSIPEKFNFNNTLVIPFHVTIDKINPFVDITFDGRHIIDGELVSAKPMIQLSLEDENPYLALDNPNDFALSFIYPDGSQHPISLNVDNDTIRFIPASLTETEKGNNKAIIELTPTFVQDGIYELAVGAKDKTGNNFADASYKVSFEIITESLISNVLNYPNPFTSSTRFLFTLTGSEIPAFFNIQIMTISGRVVREVTQAEIGPIRVGQNKSEFVWDGTDEFGNPLGNGVYLYRVVTRLQGQKLDLHQTSTKVDDLFKNGIGKMYLMR